MGATVSSAELTEPGPPTAVTVVKVKPASEAVPPGVVTLTKPEVPLPTTAVIVVALTTVKEDAAVPPKLTVVAPEKLFPDMVTVDPVPAVKGVNELITGAGINVKPANDPVPPGVVTLTKPKAPLPTTAVIVVGLTIVKEDAAVPPKLTVVAPEKLFPDMVTVVPVPAVKGINELITGAGINVKPASEAVPPGVVILTKPDVPLPTIAVIVLVLTTVKEVAAVPPKLTAVAPLKLFPVIVTVVPAPAVTGVNEPMTGPGIKVKPTSESVPPGVITLTAPDAPLPTAAVIVLALTTVKDEAAVPPNLTTVAPVKLEPEMVIVVPVPAAVGENELTTGAVK